MSDIKVRMLQPCQDSPLTVDYRQLFYEAGRIIVEFNKAIVAAQLARSSDEALAIIAKDINIPFSLWQWNRSGADCRSLCQHYLAVLEEEKAK